MNLVELKNLLNATELPVAYSHFVDTELSPAPRPPFITYLVLDSSNFHADNRTYTKINNVNIELYTEKKDLGVESKIEEILDNNDIPYETSETWIEAEKLFQKVYEIGVI